MRTPARPLRAGDAIPLEQLGIDLAAPVTVTITAAVADPGKTPDLVALAVDGSGKIRSDDDVVYYNNPASVDGAVGWLGRSGSSESVRILPGRVEPGIARVVLGCAGGALETGAAVPLTLTLTGRNGVQVASAQFASEPGDRAVIALEMYRRGEQWRCRLLGQGYAGGLAALVTEFGVNVDDPGKTERDPTPGSPAPAAPEPAGSSDPCGLERGS